MLTCLTPVYSRTALTKERRSGTLAIVEWAMPDRFVGLAIRSH